MKKELMTLFALICAISLKATPPEIYNVVASQREGTKLVDITYDAVDADGDLLKIRVEISDNDGQKYSIPAFTLTGDVGDGITPGTGKKITWDAGKDWDGEYSDQMRVKIFAVDAQGFPGMEWGNEIPPGGFLLGQDGGAEGGGPSRHVNIPWSYWLSKYEVTVGQYCDFLNAAFAAGVVGRDSGNTTVLSSVTTNLAYCCCAPQAKLCDIGDVCQIRWNVNNFEVVGNITNQPAKATLAGACLFARFYGYDIPTEAEWEKGARGPDHDDQDEHLLYPWGDSITEAYANISGTLRGVGYYDGNQTPVGPDTMNGYGLYDVIGNAPEWTKTRYDYAIESYPTQESQYDPRHNTYVTGYGSGSLVYTVSRSVRGEKSNTIYHRNKYQCSNSYGFRVVRRHEAEKWENVTCEIKENFNGWEPSSFWSGEKTVLSGIWKATNGSASIELVGVDNSRAVLLSNTMLYLPATTGNMAFVRLKIKNVSTSTSSISFYDDDLNSYDSIGLPANMQSFCTIDLPSPSVNGSNYKLWASYIIIDDIEIWTTPREETAEK